MPRLRRPLCPSSIPFSTPPPQPSVLPVFSPTLVHSFEILLRGKSLSVDVYLWKLSRGDEADAETAILLGNLEFPRSFSPFSVAVDGGKLAFGTTAFPSANVPAVAQFGFLFPPSPSISTLLWLLLCCLCCTPVPVTLGWPNIEFQRRKGPGLGS